MDGYQVVDLKDINLSAAPTVIEGVYEKIEGAYRKAIMLTNITISNVEKHSAFVEPSVSEGNYEFLLYGHLITITKDDKVSAAQQGALAKSRKVG